MLKYPYHTLRSTVQVKQYRHVDGPLNSDTDNDTPGNMQINPRQSLCIRMRNASR